MGGQFDPLPLQISAVEGSIGVKIGTDIKKHVKNIAAFFGPKKFYLI